MTINGRGSNGATFVGDTTVIKCQGEGDDIAAHSMYIVKNIGAEQDQLVTISRTNTSGIPSANRSTVIVKGTTTVTPTGNGYLQLTETHTRCQDTVICIIISTKLIPISTYRLLTVNGKLHFIGVSFVFSVINPQRST